MQEGGSSGRPSGFNTFLVSVLLGSPTKIGRTTKGAPAPNKVPPGQPFGLPSGSPATGLTGHPHRYDRFLA
jgi:hypothetical protein